LSELSVGNNTRGLSVIAGILGILVGIIGLYLDNVGVHSVTWDDITIDWFSGQVFEAFIILFAIWCFSISLYFMSYIKSRGGYVGILAGLLSLIAIIPWMNQYLMIRFNTGSLNSEHYFAMVSLLELAVLILGLALVVGGIVPLLRVRNDKILGLTGFSLISVGCFGIVIGLRGFAPGFTFFDWYWIPFFTMLSLIPSVLLIAGYRIRM
jgi:hypothetical protein